MILFVCITAHQHLMIETFSWKIRGPAKPQIYKIKAPTYFCNFTLPISIFSFNEFWSCIFHLWCIWFREITMLFPVNSYEITISMFSSTSDHLIPIPRISILNSSLLHQKSLPYIFHSSFNTFNCFDLTNCVGWSGQCRQGRAVQTSWAVGQTMRSNLASRCDQFNQSNRIGWSCWSDRASWARYSRLIRVIEID